MADPRVLIRGPAGRRRGARKALKNSVLVDLAPSLGARVDAPFLGHFPVAKRARVGRISGESGEAARQEIAGRIATSKPMNLAA